MEDDTEAKTDVSETTNPDEYGAALLLLLYILDTTIAGATENAEGCRVTDGARAPNYCSVSVTLLFLDRAYGQNAITW